MVERGVRFVMLTHASWDDHTDLNRKLKRNCDIADKPTAALIRDLKQRGLLDTTLVVWGGEFGRTPMVEIRDPRDENNAGRDHHPLAYSMFLAGGGIKGGQVIGKTDDLCMNIVEDKVHVHDLQATMLALPGPGAHAADVPPHGPGFPADGRGGERGDRRCWRESGPGLIPRTEPLLRARCRSGRARGISTPR